MIKQQKSVEAKTSKEAALSDTELDKATGGGWLLKRIIDAVWHPIGHGDHRRPLDRP